MVEDGRTPSSGSSEAFPEEERDRQRRSAAARAFFRHHQQKGRGYTLGAPIRVPKSSAKRRARTDGAEYADESDLAVEAGQPKPWVAPPGTYRSKTGTGPSNWDPQPIGRILKCESMRRGWEQPLAVASVTTDWSEIVGPQVAQHCPVESFEGGVVIAQADSTAWAQQLQLLLPLVQRRIDEKVGPGVVEKVIVRPPRSPSWKHGNRTVQGPGPRDTYG